MSGPAAGRAVVVDAAAAELTAAEADALRAGGFDLVPRPPPADDPLVRTITACAALIEGSLTTGQAAARLRIDPSRVEQRLAERRLYGIRPHGDWLLPRFQFGTVSTLPGLGEVVEALDPELHPLAVQAFFLRPNDELEDERLREPVSPRDWLAAGLDPVRVRRLAEHL